MARPPVVLLAFANDRTGRHASLSQELAKERLELGRIFESAARCGACQPEILPDATPQSLVAAFQNPAWRDRITLLHISGHADAERLLFEREDGGVMAVAGLDLAEFLSTQRGLALVFLNGCATAGHIAALLRAGVKAVIATRHKVDGLTACDFAAFFYRALVEGNLPLSDAYREARDGARLTGGASRGLSYSDDPAKDPSAPPPGTAWELHLHPALAATGGAWRFHAVDPLHDLPLPPDIGLPPAPFLNLRCFGREQARVFFGRAADIRRVHDLLTAPESAPVVLLLGSSGVGKSSLLGAGLLPRLEGLFELCEPAAPYTPPGPYPDSPARPRLYLLDHAETLLPEYGTDPAVWQGWLAAWAAPIQAARTSGDKWLLVFRKEYLAEISAGLDAHGLAYAKHYLERLDYASVMEAIEGAARPGPCRDKYGLTLAADTAARIAQDVLADPAAPVAPTLQILLARLWARATAQHQAKPVIDVALYEAEKRRGLLLDDFLREALAELARRQAVWVDSGLALDILGQHTSPLGTAADCSAAGLAAEYAHVPAELSAILRFFTDHFILADATPPGQSAPKITRLAHDLLAPLVRHEGATSTRPGQVARRILEQHASATYLPVDDLPAIEFGRYGMRVWNGTEIRLIQAARRRRRRQHGLLTGLGLVACAALLSVAWQGWDGLRGQSLHLAELSRQATDQGRADLGTALALEALPATGQWRPWVAVAETALAYSLSQPQASAVVTATARVFDAAFDPSGESLASAGEQGATLWTLDATASRPTPRLNLPHGGPVYQVQPVAAGAWLTAGEDGVRLWNADGSPRWQVQTGNAVLHAALDPTGNTLATLDSAGTVRLWPEPAAHPLPALGRALPIAGRVRHFVFSPDGADLWVAVGHAVQRWTVSDGTRRDQWTQPEPVWRVGFMPDGRTWFSASAHTVRLHDAAGRAQRHIPLNTSLTGLAVSPDGRWLATAGEAGVVIHPIPTGRERWRIALDTAAGQLAFAPDSRRLIVATAAGARLYVLRHGIETWRTDHAGAVEDGAFSPDGRWLATAGLDGAVRLLDAKTGQTRFLWQHGGAVRQVAYSPQGHWIGTASADGTARLYDPVTGREARRVVLRGAATRIQFSPDETRWLIGTDTGAVSVRATRPDAELFGLALDGPVEALAFSPDGQAIAASSRQRTRVWRAADGRAQFDWTPGGPLAWSQDGRWLARASGGAAWVVDVRRGGEDRVFPHPGETVSRVTFSPDGRWLVTVAGRAVFVWDRAAGKLNGRLPHPQPVTDAAISPDGRFIATAAQDGLAEGPATVGAWLWDGATGQVRYVLPHDATVWRVLFSPTGEGLATLAPDGGVRWWGWGALQRTGRALVDYARLIRRGEE